MAKARSPKGSQGSRPGEALKPETVTLKVTVSREVARRLKLESFGRDCSLGRVVEDLVRAAPCRFSLVDRGRGSQGPDVQGSPASPGLSSPRGEVGPLGVVSSDVA
jgi:hypothetical protein